MDGMRVRVRLDQQRISSLLAGISPDTMGGQFADVASGVLSMLGDMASLSFARYHTGMANESCMIHNLYACCPYRLRRLHICNLSSMVNTKSVLPCVATYQTLWQANIKSHWACLGLLTCEVGRPWPHVHLLSRKCCIEASCKVMHETLKPLVAAHLAPKFLAGAKQDN